MIHSARPIDTPLFSVVLFFLDLKSGDGQTTCAKTIIPTGRDFGLAEWIKRKKKKKNKDDGRFQIALSIFHRSARKKQAKEEKQLNRKRNFLPSFDTHFLLDGTIKSAPICPNVT